jgi:dUTP pyrophosphatase
MNIKIKTTNKDAFIPTKATDGSNGFDVVAINDGEILTLLTGGFVKYQTGLALEIPKGYCAMLLPRSSIYKDTTLLLQNSMGLIDSDYRGEISFIYRNVAQGGAAKKYNKGEKIGQIVFVKTEDVNFVQVENLSETSRGTGGFGSTGK